MVVCKYNPTNQNENIVFKTVVIVFRLFFKHWLYGIKQGPVVFHCLPGIPQQLLNGFCSKCFFGSLFRIQIEFSHGHNILGDQVPRPAGKSLLNLKWNETKVS